MKSTIKYSRFLIGLLVVVVAVIAVWNKVLLNRCNHNAQIQRKQISNFQHNIKEVEEAVLKSQSAAMMHLDSTLTFTGIERFFPEKLPPETELESFDHPRLILVFSELSCNVCQDKETEFAITIASNFGQDYVMAIVHAVKKRYVQNYTRLNQVNFPVYCCDDRDRSFFKVNKIINTPILLIIDRNNRIIAAHIPIPGHPEYSDPIHQFCFDYLGKSTL